MLLGVAAFQGPLVPHAEGCLKGTVGEVDRKTRCRRGRIAYVRAADVRYRTERFNCMREANRRAVLRDQFPAADKGLGMIILCSRLGLGIDFGGVLRICDALMPHP